MQARGHFTRREQTRHARHLRVAINRDAAHDIVRGWSNFHALLRNVHARELLELVVHAWQFALDVLGGVWQFLLDPSNIQIHAAVRRAATSFNFSIDATRNMVAREQLRRTVGVLVAAHIAPAFLLIDGNLIFVRVRNVVKHKALAFAVAKHAALAAHAFGHKNAAHAWRPHHSSWMELHKLHVHQFSAGLIRKRVSVASAFPTIAGNTERFADAAGGQNDGFRLPNSHAAALAVIAQHAGNFAAGCQQ